MTDNTSDINKEIKANGRKLETITSFKYLCSVVSDESSKLEILSRIAQTTVALKIETNFEHQEQFSQLQDTTDALPCHTHLSVCLWIMDPYSRDAKKNTSHGNEVLPQDTTLLIQRPCYQRGSPCQDPAGNRTTRRPSDHCKETGTEVVWTCLPFIGSGQIHFARQGERGKKTW